MAKYLHVITSLQRSAGTSVFCIEICDELKSLGHEVTIAVGDWDQIDSYSSRTGVQIVSIDSLFQSCLLRNSPPRFDIVHIHALWSPILHKVASWARKMRIPLVWSPHGMLTPWALNHKRAKKWLALLLYQYLDLKRAALLHVTAESEVMDVRRLGFRNPISVVPLGVRLPHQMRTPDSKRPTGNILFLSRIHPKKGLPILLRAFADVEKKNCGGKNRWRLLIVGPDSDGHKSELITLSESLGLSVMDSSGLGQSAVAKLQDDGFPQDVIFTGPLFDVDRDKIHEISDLFVLPSYSENFGVVVIDALAFQIPVITTVGTPWSEIETEGCGLWIEIGVSPLISALKRLMTVTDEERFDMGVRGYRLVAQKYAWTCLAKCLAADYNRILRTDIVSRRLL